MRAAYARRRAWPPPPRSQPPCLLRRLPATRYAHLRAGPRKLLDYLGRYTHRVAISNHRILSCEEGEVRFRYRDRRDGDRMKTEVHPAEGFLRRFLEHVPPDGLLRIRTYGRLANRGVQAVKPSMESFSYVVRVFSELT